MSSLHSFFTRSHCIANYRYQVEDNPAGSEHLGFQCGEGLHTYGGMAGRDMEALAIGISEGIQDDHIRSRIEQVRYLGNLLINWNIPIVRPVGGHAIFLGTGHSSAMNFASPAMASSLRSAILFKFAMAFRLATSKLL